MKLEFNSGNAIKITKNISCRINNMRMSCGMGRDHYSSHIHFAATILRACLGRLKQTQIELSNEPDVLFVGQVDETAT